MSIKLIIKYFQRKKSDFLTLKTIALCPAEKNVRDIRLRLTNAKNAFAKIVTRRRRNNI